MKNRKRRSSGYVNPEDAFVQKGWIPTEQGLWRKVKSTEAFVTFYPQEQDDETLVYEFSIHDPKGISWKNSRKVLKEIEDLLPYCDVCDESQESLSPISHM